MKVIAITNINTVTIKNCIVDEIHTRQSTDISVNLTSSKDAWKIDTYLLAKFNGDLEAGNVDNDGVQIVQFAIKRRKISELTPRTLGYVEYTEDHSVEFKDYTAANDNYIYSIVPVGENGLEGSPNNVTHSSSFTGVVLVDTDTDRVLVFDKFIGSEPNVDMQLNQSRVEIQTFSKYPTVYYQTSEFHKFSLSTVLIGDDTNTSGKLYENFLNNFVRTHKQILVKVGGSGELYVCDISNPRKSAPLNLWNGRDYVQITIDLTEVDSVENYMG